MLSWLPIIGPFLSAGVKMFTKAEDATVDRAKIAADRDVGLGAQDVQIIQARASHKDDIGTEFARDVILNWYAIYVSLIFYDSCFRELLPTGWTWRVLALPTSLEILCTAIIAFLFYTAWRGK